jgi:hypothetical protein
MSNFRQFVLSTMLGAFCVTGHGQVIHSGEETFVIAVTGGPGVTFRGNYLVTGVNGEPKETPVAGTVPAEFRARGVAVYLSLQNQAPGGEIEIRVGSDGKRELDKNSAASQKVQFLAVTISKNGTTLKEQRTDAPHGIVSLATTMPAWGAPRQTELIVDGSAKFAFLTFTGETGDTQQELVPIPFSKSFFPKEGWVVGITAQKVKVTRLDPFSNISTGPITQVLDDGRSGLLHVSIRVNGSAIGEAATSEAFGVASSTARIP